MQLHDAILARRQIRRMASSSDVDDLDGVLLCSVALTLIQIGQRQECRPPSLATMAPRVVSNPWVGPTQSSGSGLSAFVEAP